MCKHALRSQYLMARSCAVSDSCSVDEYSNGGKIETQARSGGVVGRTATRQVWVVLGPTCSGIWQVRPWNELKPVLRVASTLCGNFLN